MDAKGHLSEQGTIEEWWKSPSLYKIVYASPSYKSTELQTAAGLYRTRDQPSAPYLLDSVLQQVVHPLAESEVKDGVPDLRRETFGKVQLDCIMITQPIKNVAYPPLGLFPTYCLDRDRDSLRASYNFGTQMVLRNSIGKFQNHLVTVDQKLIQNTVEAISAHIDDLRTAAITEAELTPSADMERIDGQAATVASGVVQGYAMSQPRPVYPERAKRNHVSGTVLIGVIIGTDGRIHSMKLLKVPDPDLAIAAITAVRQWTYRPYMSMAFRLRFRLRSP